MSDPEVRLSLTNDYESDASLVRRLETRDAARNPMLFFLLGAGLFTGMALPGAVSIAGLFALTVPLGFGFLIFGIVCASKNARPSQGSLIALWVYGVVVIVTVLASLSTIFVPILAIFGGGIAAFLRAGANP